MKNSNNPRLGIIGCGAVTELLYIPALKKMRWVPMLLVDTNKDRTQLLSRTFKVVKTATDFEDYIGDIDAAIVALPNNLHEPISSYLLQNGVNVLVEKPMAISESECASMITSAKKGQSVLSVGLFRRYLYGARWTKAAIDAGVIGEVRSFDFREGLIYQHPLTSDSSWRKEIAGGGVLIDTGAHTLDLLTWWLGDAVQVEYKDDAYGGLEADCIINVTMESNATGVIELSRTRNLRGTAIIEGTRGRLEVNLTQNQVTITPSDLLSFKYNGMDGFKFPPQGAVALFIAQLQEWRSAIIERRVPFITGEEGARSIKLIERCYRERKLWVLPWVSNGSAGL